MLSRFTVIWAGLEPNWFVHTTLMVLGPEASVTGLLIVLVVEAPFTVHVVPAGIVELPLTVNTTFMVVAVVQELFAGEVIATGWISGGRITRVTVVVPNWLVQVTVIVFAPGVARRCWSSCSWSDFR